MSETENTIYPSMFNKPIFTELGVEIYKITAAGIRVSKLDTGETAITAFDKDNRIIVTIDDAAKQHLIGLLNN